MTDTSALRLPESTACALCDYLLGRRPYTVWFKEPLIAGLVTREQRGVSHVLVLPVRHCPTILDLSEEESGALMVGIRRAARVIDLTEHRPGIAIWQNNGVPAHQTIPHLHFHVAGTLPGGGTEWGPVPELSLADANAIAEKLKSTESGHPN
jgi:histidine triad (HIT) family protein